MSGKFERTQEKTKPSFTLSSWLFVMLMMLYCEIMLHLWSGNGFQLGRLIAIAAFSAGSGLILGLISTFFGKKIGKWVAVGIGVILVVVCLGEYFMLDAYKNFMTVETIVAGAGGVAEDYLGMILSLLVRNLWRIALMLLPIALYALFGKAKGTSWKFRGVLAACVLAAYLLGFGAVNLMTNDASVMNRAYNFDRAVRCFGLGMGFTLDTIRSGDAEDEMMLTVPEPVVPPTQPQEVQQDQQQEQTVVYEDNVYDHIDFAKLGEEMKDESLASIYRYMASVTPTKQNEYTGLFEGKNLIFITAEAFTKEVIDPELTPTLYRLATEGIEFTDYYQPAWGASTTTGEFSNTIGLVPAKGGSSMMMTRTQPLFFTIGAQLQARGYHSAAYHNHTHDFYNRHMTHKGLGYDAFYARGQGMPEIKGVWPESDVELIDFSITDYIDQQPFSIYYMTVSGHCMYNLKENAMSRKNWEAVKDLPYSESVRCYLAANLELEYAMEKLLGYLEEAGILDDTVIVIGTDHYPYGLERSSTYKNETDYLTELFGEPCSNKFVREHNALIIWSGSIEGMDLKVETPTYSLDILPTLCNLFGMDYDSRMLVGRDVLSTADPLVLWPDYSWKTDKGSYDASTGVYTSADGSEMSQDYIDYIDAIVANKISYSRTVQNKNIFRLIKMELEAAGVQVGPLKVDKTSAKDTAVEETTAETTEATQPPMTTEATE